MNDFFDHALHRIIWISIILGMAGAVLLLVVRGSRDAGGFFVGAAISTLSLESWKMLARGLDAAAGMRVRGLAILIGARYLIAGGVIYVIVKVSGITLVAVFAGLLISLAAVLLEFLYELAFPHH